MYPKTQHRKLPDRWVDQFQSDAGCRRHCFQSMSLRQALRLLLYCHYTINKGSRRLTLTPLTLLYIIGCGSDVVCCFQRSEEHTSELQSRFDLVCRLLLEK